MVADRKKGKIDQKTEALIAASIYDELDAEEQKILQQQLNSDPMLMEEWVELRTLADFIPKDDIEFQGDLLPSLRQQIAEDKQRQIAWLPLKWIIPFAAAGLIITAYIGNGGFRPSPNSGLGMNPVPAVPAIVAVSPIRQMLDDSDSLIANGDWLEAQSLLGKVMTRNPDELESAEAQLKLADLQFSKLHKYAQAHSAYTILREKYPETFSTSPVNVDRFNLLSEAKADDYNALHMIDDVRDKGVDSFTQLEALVASHPNSFVASLAVDALREEIAVPKSMSQESQILALEAVRTRCKNPVAIAQINLELGRLYAGELGDVETARRLYQTIADSAPATLARSARTALDELASAR